MSTSATAATLATAIVLGASIRVDLTVRDGLLIAWDALVGRSLLGESDLQAGQLAADSHLVETLLERFVLVVDHDR